MQMNSEMKQGCSESKVYLSKDTHLPGGSDGKESDCSAGVPGSIPKLGRSPGKRNGYPLQYSCLDNLMDREAWWDMVHGITKSQTQVSN